MSLKIYIDTNIYINSIENRDNNISKKVLFFLKNTDTILYINDISIINIHYITRKTTHRDEIEEKLKVILEEHELVSIDKYIIKNSFDSDFKDFEDAIQYFCAKKVNADLIITDNTKDFKNSDIKILSAKEFYENYILEDF